MKYLKDIEKFVENKVVFCGIDVHKHHWNLCFMSDGSIVERNKMTADFYTLQRHLKKFYHGARKLHFVYEAGFSGFYLYRQLQEAGYTCIITPPNRIPKYKDKVKTDKRDAVKLARYLAGGLLKEVYVPPKTIVSDRQVLRLRNDHQKKLSRVKNQIRSLLQLHGIVKPDWAGTNWTKKHVSWLSTITFEEPGLQFTLDHYLEEYRFYRSKLASLTNKLRHLSRDETYRQQYKILSSCPGIGLITAMTFLLELYEIVRFSSAQKLSSYIGLTPSQHSSGEHVRLGHITREGNAHIRRVLVESAWTVIRHEPFLREKYHRIRAKGTNGKKAIVGVARSLAVRLRRCLIDEVTYEVGIC